MENGYFSNLFYVDNIPSTKFDLYVAQIVLFFLFHVDIMLCTNFDLYMLLKSSYFMLNKFLSSVLSSELYIYISWNYSQLFNISNLKYSKNCRVFRAMIVVSLFIPQLLA